MLKRVSYRMVRMLVRAGFNLKPVSRRWQITAVCGTRSESVTPLAGLRQVAGITNESVVSMLEAKVVEALTAHDAQGKKVTEYRVKTSIDTRVVSTSTHRFSAFLELHAALAKALSLPAFPAARALIVTEAVKRQRCESLGIFLRDAATAAAAQQAQPPLALLDFLDVHPPTATLGAGAADLECPSAVGVATPTASSSSSPKTVMSTLDGEEPAVAELVAARAEAKAAAEAAAEWAERAAAAAAFEARAEAAEAALAQASPQRKLRESTAAVEAAEAALEAAEAALAAQARQVAEANDTHEAALQAARAEAEEAAAAARAEVDEAEERWRGKAEERAREHAAALEALRDDRAAALEAAAAHERRRCEAAAEEKGQRAAEEAALLRERCAAAEARAEVAEEAHGERGAQLGMMQRAAAAAERRARRAAVAATAGDVARLEERVAAAEASTLAALARAQAAEARADAAEARAQEMAASQGAAVEAAREREAEVRRALASAADALAAEESARRAALAAVVVAEETRGAAAADLTYLRNVALSTLCRALTAETRAEVEALAPPLQAVFGFGADDAAKLRSAIEHRYAQASYAPPSVGALFSSMLSPLSAAGAGPPATPSRAASPLDEAGAGIGFLSPLEHLADADAGGGAGTAALDLRSPANLDMRRAEQPGLDRGTSRPVARPGQLAHC